MITKPTFFKFTGILIVFALFIQFVIIFYNHLSGYFTLEGTNDFFIRWAIGSVLSLIVLPFFTLPDLYLVKKLNQFTPWENQWKIRLAIELIAAFLIAVIGSLGITLFAHFLSPYPEGVQKVIITNIMIGSVINIIIIIFLEAWNWYRARAQSEVEKNKLESELKLMRFEILKQQINPHFMFNSLNVLSGLIRKDADLAEQFIEAFADVYRYVMETIEKPIVSLSDELQFARTYFFLQQIRHGDGVEWTVDLPVEFMNYQLPPLSLQLLLENAIKHNSFSTDKPLLITILLRNENLQVKNIVRKKTQNIKSSGTGLTNLKKRYSLVSEHIPSFSLKDDAYIANLPLIKPTS